MQERANEQFERAMEEAKRCGCEKRDQLLAKRVGIALEP
jgi:hypothetical protein